ncbi:modular serine protease isoform X3 [Acyrthosiphon pisum]|uniref:Uncharacterized protein n=1 Tax=Acyrthosiphon pisum TaxID=7029 RepID=A0A8R2JPG1_ACYPI|nr:modular serine protease isoform X3 [Acyrthosiphon pisum]
MTMKSLFSWLTCFCFIFETGILCDRKLEKRQTIFSCPGVTEYGCGSGECIDVSNTCNGIRDCSDGSDETSLLCETVLCPAQYTFRCKYGACISNKNICDGIEQCADGSDEEKCPNSTLISTFTSSIPKKPDTAKPKPITAPSHIKKTCRIPAIEGTKYFYKDRNQNFSLSHATEIEQYRIIEEDCEAGYYKVVPYRFMVCSESGQWRPFVTEELCLTCGLLYTPSEVLNDGKVEYGTVPWSVGLYRQIKSRDGFYELICGGTLIALNKVITAAQCYWEEGYTNKILMNEKHKYKIAVGKYTSDLSIKDNNFTQIIDVGFVYLKESYYGPSGYYADDLAIIVLQTHVTISDVVMPACIDWFKQYSVPNGSIGKVFGWGKSEDLETSSVLLEANVSYTDKNTCRDMYSNGFQSLVTIDKFCVVSQLEQSITEGFIGSGLTFEHGAIQFLTGIASVMDPYTNDLVAVFTDVSHHIQWIRERLL